MPIAAPKSRVTGNDAGGAARNLVVVRAGRTSLHAQWLAARAERDWDIVVSYYDKSAYDADDSGERKVLVPGGKYDGLHKTIDEFVDLSRYDYVWLPDDDIETTAKTIDLLFAQARKYDLAICQPALTPDSHFSHFMMLACEGFHLRYSNFVEIMVPCLRRDTLERMLPFFARSMSGFGFDHAWCRLQAENWMGAAIFDTVRVRHTRPIGVYLRPRILDAGKSPEDEERKLNAEFGVDGPILPLAYAGVASSGRVIEGQRRMGLRMAAAYLAGWGGYPDRPRAWKEIRRMVRRHFKQEADLAPLIPARSEAPGLTAER